MWIRNTKNGNLYNIRDCVRIKKGTIYEDIDNKDVPWRYYINFKFERAHPFDLKFKKEKERNNFYNQLVDYIKPHQIDPIQETLKI